MKSSSIPLRKIQALIIVTWKESSTSEDLKLLHEEDYISSSEEECRSCPIGQPYDKDRDEFCQLYSKFKDLNINVKSNDNWVEILRMIDDPTLRS